jgi:excisionase family DNA binding protein
MDGKSVNAGALTKRLLTINELATEIGGTKWFWRTMIWDGQLPYVQVGRKMFVDKNDIEKFIAKNKHKN